MPGEGLEAELSVVTFRSLKLVPMLAGVLRALKGGGVKGKTIDVRSGVRDVTIEYDTPFPYQLDGDHLGDTKRLQFTWVPDAIQLVTPPAP